MYRIGLTMFSENGLLTIALVLDKKEEAKVMEKKWVNRAWKNRPTKGEFYSKRYSCVLRPWTLHEMNRTVRDISALTLYVFLSYLCDVSHISITYHLIKYI